MDIGSLMRDHIYTAIVIGSLLEGETTVVLGGYAAHQGYAPWWAVTLLSFGINFCWDQVYYALGRWRGPWLLSRFSGFRLAAERLSPRIHRHRRWLVFSLRFMYGLRTVGPIALGIARVPWKEFFVLNALGALVWVVLFSTLGYIFGKVVATLVGQIVHYELQAVAAIFACGILWFVWHHFRRLRATSGS